MKLLLAFVFSFFAFTLACAGQNMSSAQDTVSYVMDTSSYLAWSCDKHYGVVPLKSGVLKMVNGQPVEGNFVILMDSLKDKDIDYKLMRETLHNTLKSQFFFDVKNYPTVDFRLDYAEPAGKNTFNVSGDLKIKGVVNCIRFKSTIHADGKKLTAVSDKFFIDRTQYGITIYSESEAVDDNSVIVSDEIYFVVHLFGTRLSR